MNGSIEAEGLFDEYDGPIVYEVDDNSCGFSSPADLAHIYAVFGIGRNPLKDYDLISRNPKITILANGRDYRIAVSAWGYKQISSSPGLEEGHILPFRRVG